MSASGLMIAAPRSSSGKTTITIALLAALKARGLRMKSAKTGPDYIDPAFHTAATGQTTFNLDSWAMPPPLLDNLMCETAENADLFLVEAAMGLFDRIEAPPGRSGAPADVAARFGLPVILVLDVSGQAQSAAAVAKGFSLYNPSVTICGVIANRVGSERHLRMVRNSIEAIGIPFLGAIPRMADIAIPERHLGLVQIFEHPSAAAFLERLRELAEQHLDLEKIVSSATLPQQHSKAEGIAMSPPGQRIALARDAAFSFTYAHLLEGWRSAGAEIVFFSPLADEPPPNQCDACWLPGGYPELHAQAIAGAETFKSGLREFAETRPVHGECGGYMVLGQVLINSDNNSYEMAGLLSHETTFAKKKLHLGYRRAKLIDQSWMGGKTSVIRGHEFHYASILSEGCDAPLVEVVDGEGRPLGKAGHMRGHVSGTFFHAIAVDN
ncbi:cobyrinate a,c-diamide synthase [Rhodoligotrophos appendicifer]|uniref:cobyrinate a,c-diamide synthase n=1 Tax=Rhodoligotrophos appendicifer TaxID=987056 RepID=UPI0011867997|nr:cobyrinate a,c-diamide synthase [Rhodoligotrophos appendicifer]